jgi:hypothetical protein
MNDLASLAGRTVFVGRRGLRENQSMELGGAD